MNGSGVNHPPNGLTVPVSGHPTMATRTTVMLPVQHKQWVVYVINPQQVASHMVHVLPGYAPVVPLYAQQATALPPHGAYRPTMPQWQPQTTAVSRPSPRTAPSTEPAQDEHYNYLRHTHHDRLDSLRAQDWQYVAHMLKPEMERCGLSLPNEKAAMDILLQLREAQNIDSFEQLEAALLEWLSNEETQVKQPLSHDMSPDYVRDDTLGMEHAPDDVRSLVDSVISESEETGSSPEAPEETSREITSDYDTMSDVSSHHDLDMQSDDLPASPSHQDQVAPISQQQQPAKTGKRKRFSPKAFVGWLAKRFGKGSVKPESEKTRVDHSLLSEQDLRRDGFSYVSLPPACEYLQDLGGDVEVRWDYLTIAADEHQQFISLLHEKDMENADPQAWRDRVFKRTGLASMEAIHERKQDVVTGLRKAASDLAVALDEYRMQEAVVALESGNYDENLQKSLSAMQKRINSIEPRLEKVQNAIKKMR